MLGRGKVKQLLKPGPDNHHQTLVKATHRATASVLGASTGPGLPRLQWAVLGGGGRHKW